MMDIVKTVNDSSVIEQPFRPGRTKRIKEGRTGLSIPKFGPLGMKWLKILHTFFVVLFLGGILSSFALNLNVRLWHFDEVYATYQSLIIISDNIVEYGAQATIVLGVIYGVFTTWGFFKHKWLTVKWVIFVGQTFAGILLVDRLMVANMLLLETEGSAALSNPVFLHNHYLRQSVVIVQIVLTLFMIIISVLKPWRSTKKAARLTGD
jgi:hypothetical protein